MKHCRAVDKLRPILQAIPDAGTHPALGELSADHAGRRRCAARARHRGGGGLEIGARQNRHVVTRRIDLNRRRPCRRRHVHAYRDVHLLRSEIRIQGCGSQHSLRAVVVGRPGASRQRVGNGSRNRQRDCLCLRGQSKPMQVAASPYRNYPLGRVAGHPASLPASPTHAGNRIDTEVHLGCISYPDGELIRAGYGRRADRGHTERSDGTARSGGHGRCFVQGHIRRSNPLQGLRITDNPVARRRYRYLRTECVVHLARCRIGGKARRSHRYGPGERANGSIPSPC